MILCLVTDRRRLGAALGLGADEWIDALRAQVVAAASAGVDLVQVREPDLEAAALTQLVRVLVADTRQTSTRILVNDRADVALVAAAAGVHLKERSVSVNAARSLGPPGFLIGRSIHSTAIEDFSRNADYFIVGTVLPSLSKPSAACLGWAGLSEVVKAAGDRPVLAIGGIDVPSTPFVAASGAAGVAAIGAFIPAAGQALVEFVQKRVIEMRYGFDSAHLVS